MDFDQVQAEFQKLKAQFEAGALTETEFKARLQDLMIQDEQGQWWMIGYETGLWYYHDGEKWVQAKPPQVEERPREEADALYQEGAAALVARDWTKAIESFQAVLGPDPTHTEAANQLAEAQAGLERQAAEEQARREEEARRAEPAQAEVPPAPVPTPQAKVPSVTARPRGINPLWIGGVALLGLLVLVVALAQRSGPGPAPTPTQPVVVVVPTATSRPPITPTATPPFEPEMVLIPAGEFLMGSARQDELAETDEQPQHPVDLLDYYIAKTEVTNSQYAAFVAATGNTPPAGWQAGKPPQGKEDHPVVNVSWYDALAYCEWLSEVTGKQYRLPSEAEWEKAARGTEGLIWPWGNTWESGRCNKLKEEEGIGDTTPVGTYPAYPEGASGLVDMAGNVWEWTSSLWGKDENTPDFKYPYDPADGRENLEADGNILRVLRGGSFSNDRKGVRCAVRSREVPNYRDGAVGFRVAASP